MLIFAMPLMILPVLNCKVKNLTWQNPEQQKVAQELIKNVL
jgi:hypothetical protein